MLTISPLNNNSYSQSFGAANLRFKPGIKEKLTDAIFNNVPSHQGLIDKYLKENGKFNLDLLVRHLNRLIHEEPSLDGKYVVDSIRKQKKNNVFLATVKHFDDAGKEIKGDEFKFNPLNLLAKHSENQTEIRAKEFFDSLMNSGRGPVLKKQITQKINTNFWNA